MVPLVAVLDAMSRMEFRWYYTNENDGPFGTSRYISPVIPSFSLGPSL